MPKDKINRYAFRIPLLFEGDRGSGKTYDVREYARANDLPCLEIAGHESLESFDFLGHVVQTAHGMAWKDGKLSQAFRMAAGGKKTVLVIDEILRIPQRHLSVLLSALSADSDGNYRLQTGRMTAVVDGIGSEEEIICPKNGLAIFATTNVGPEFAVDDLDPAVAERFIIIRKDTEPEILQRILAKKAEARGFNRMVAVRLVELFNKTHRMVKTGTLNRHATTRTLARALDEAIDENDVVQVLKDQILLWADRDSSGEPVGEQTKALEKTIDDLFRDLAPPKPRTVPSSATAPAGAVPKAPVKRVRKAPAPAAAPVSPVPPATPAPPIPSGKGGKTGKTPAPKPVLSTPFGFIAKSGGAVKPLLLSPGGPSSADVADLAGIAGRRIALTGESKELNRVSIEALILRLGGRYDADVGIFTDVLLVGDRPGGVKTKKALTHSTATMPLQFFLDAVRLFDAATEAKREAVSSFKKLAPIPSVPKTMKAAPKPKAPEGTPVKTVKAAPKKPRPPSFPSDEELDEVFAAEHAERYERDEAKTVDDSHDVWADPEERWTATEEDMERSFKLASKVAGDLAGLKDVVSAADIAKVLHKASMARKKRTW